MANEDVGRFVTERFKVGFTDLLFWPPVFALGARSSVGTVCAAQRSQCELAADPGAVPAREVADIAGDPADTIVADRVPQQLWMPVAVTVDEEQCLLVAGQGVRELVHTVLPSGPEQPEIT